MAGTTPTSGDVSTIGKTAAERDRERRHAAAKKQLADSGNTMDWGSWEDLDDAIGRVFDNSPSQLFHPRGSATDDTMSFLKQSPEYVIPQEIYDILDKYNAASEEMISSADKDRKQSLLDIQNASAQGISTLESTRDQALGYAGDEISRMRDIQARTRKSSLDEAYGARRDSLQSLEEGGDRALDIMKLQAFGGLPGEGLTRQNMEADSAAMRSDIRERAGGSSAGLGAIASGYAQQQRGTRQLGIDRANYQASGMQTLAQGELTQSGRMAQTQLQSGMQIAGLQRGLGQDEVNAGLASSQHYANMIGRYGEDIASAQFDSGRNMAATRLQGGQQYSNALQQGTAMQGSAMGTLANFKDQAYKYNELDPYIREREFKINELRRLDTHESEMDYWGSVAGVGYSQENAGRQGENVGRNNQWNAASDFLGATANAATLYGWAEGFDGGDGNVKKRPDKVDMNNQYDYTGPNYG